MLLPYLLYLFSLVLFAAAYTGPIQEVQCTAKAAVVTLSKGSFLWSYAGGTAEIPPNIIGHMVNNSACNFSINEIQPTTSFTIIVSTCNITTYTAYDDNGVPVSVMPIQPSNYFYSFVLLANAAKLVVDDDGDVHFELDETKPKKFTLSISCQFGAQGTVGGNVVGNVTGTGGGSDGSGGDSTGVADMVDMNFNMADGSSLPDQIFAGDKLTVTVGLKDETYSALLPIWCKFSADEAGLIGFSVINNGCPQQGVVENNDDIDSISRINIRTYQTAFSAFTLVDSEHSELWYHCRLRLCINDSLCNEACWSNSTHQNPSLSTFDRRFKTDVVVTGRLGEDRSNKDLEGTKRNAVVVYQEKPGYTSLPTWLVVILILVGVLCIFGVIIGLVCCLCCGAGAGWLWRRKVYADEPATPEGPSVITIEPENYRKETNYFQ